MLGIILKIGAILGLLLLAVVILVLIILLLVMVYPVSYRLWWEKKVENMLVRAKASWLLGLLTVCFEYPTPGTVIVKLLGCTVFDSGKAPKEPVRKKEEVDRGDAVLTDTDSGVDALTDVGGVSDTVQVDSGSVSGTVQADAADDAVNDTADTHISNRFTARSRILINTIKEKILQIFEKIKNIRELTEYYLNLIKEEDTSLLFSKILTGSGRIIKSIRPRKIKGQLLLGTGSPDTTGYAMAVYGILSPYLGQNLVLTPDFEDKVLEGRLYVKGRIIIGILLIQGLKIALDRRLHSFIKKLKREVI